MGINILISLFKNFLDNIIIAGRKPIRACFTSGTKIVDDGPWIVDFCIAKTVAVLPVTQLIEFVVGVIVSSHLGDFIGRESEVSTVFLIQN